MDQQIIQDLKLDALALRNYADAVLNRIDSLEKQHLSPKKQKQADVRAAIISRVIAKPSSNTKRK